MVLISELRRRNIFGVALLYVVSGWLVLQVAELLIALIGLGEWVYRFLFVLGIICFPLVLVFSYIYEITPEGLRKEYLVDRKHSITAVTGRRIRKAIFVVAGLAVVLEIGRWLIG